MLLSGNFVFFLSPESLFFFPCILVRIFLLFPIVPGKKLQLQRRRLIPNGTVPSLTYNLYCNMEHIYCGSLQLAIFVVMGYWYMMYAMGVKATMVRLRAMLVASPRVKNYYWRRLHKVVHRTLIDEELDFG